MKKLIIKNIMLSFAILLLISAPITSFASDMWSETPDLNHETKVKSVVTEPATLTNVRPLIDVWVETPDFTYEKQDSDVVSSMTSQFVDHFHSEMYAETPDLIFS